MRERWLLPLLCAFLAQLSSSDYAVYSDGSRLDTMRPNNSDYAVDSDGSRLDTVRPDLSTARVFYGDERVNGSEFASGMAKIRRARSVEDELKAAEEQLKALQDAKTKATELHDAAKTALDRAEAEWSNATKALEGIDSKIATAERHIKEDAAILATSDEKKRNAAVEFEQAKQAFEEAEKNYAVLQTAFKARENVSEPLRAAEKKADNILITTRSELRTAEGNKEKAENELKQINENWRHSKETLEKAQKVSANINKTVEYYEKYMEIEKKRSDAKKESDNLVKQLESAKPNSEQFNDLTTKKKNFDDIVTKAVGELKQVETDYGKPFQELDRDYKIDNVNKKNAAEKFLQAKSENMQYSGQIEEKNKEITRLALACDRANQTFYEKLKELNLVNEAGQALKNASTLVINAWNIKKSIQARMDANSPSTIEQELAKVAAEKTANESLVQTLKESKSNLPNEISAKLKSKTDAENSEKETAANERASEQKYEEKVKEVNALKLKADNEKAENNETPNGKAKGGSVSDIATGLGINIGILVLVARCLLQV